MFNKPFKINRNDYKNVYFCSDFHYNHQRDFIWTPRGFDATYKHDKFIEDNCDTLTADDLLIYLGDFSLNSNAENTLNLFKRIKAQKFYIWGNHEGEPTKLYKKALDIFWTAVDDNNLVIRNNVEIYPLTLDLYKHGVDAGFHKQTEHENLLTFFGLEAIFQIGNTFFHCRHMAPLIWDKMKYDNQVSMCGHSHGNLDRGKINSLENKQLDCGVDNAIIYNKTAFFKYEEVVEIMNKKQIKIFDHHGE